MEHTAPTTITKTTMNLKPGDLILVGNAFDGFDIKRVVKVRPSEYNKRMALLTVRFGHGGQCETVEGKNTRWSIVDGQN